MQDSLPIVSPPPSQVEWNLSDRLDVYLQAFDWDTEMSL